MVTSSVPLANSPAVLRADFSDDEAWRSLQAAVQQPSPEGFEANVEFIDDPSVEEMDTEALRAAIPSSYSYSFLVIAGRDTFADAARPLLILDLQPGGTDEFRTVPAGVQAIENNLSLANMDFRDFADTARASGGVFTGF
jgi:hypothetical protein